MPLEKRKRLRSEIAVGRRCGYAGLFGTRRECLRGSPWLVSHFPSLLLIGDLVSTPARPGRRSAAASPRRKKLFFCAEKNRRTPAIYTAYIFFEKVEGARERTYSLKSY